MFRKEYLFLFLDTESLLVQANFKLCDPDPPASDSQVLGSLVQRLASFNYFFDCVTYGNYDSLVSPHITLEGIHVRSS